jgi:hypothetical protein
MRWVVLASRMHTAPLPAKPFIPLQQAAACVLHQQERIESSPGLTKPPADRFPQIKKEALNMTRSPTAHRIWIKPPAELNSQCHAMMILFSNFAIHLNCYI